jgi:glycosyltransferase involved in cell wall biosynthesis
MHNLRDELILRGHQVELVRIPFKFQPESDVLKGMQFCEGFDLNIPNGQQVDRVISLQFPAYGVKHERHVVWVMHQHRAVYELYDQQAQTPQLAMLRQEIHDYDQRVLSQAYRLFANSGRVAQRLQQYNGLIAEPLYHPPPYTERFVTAEPLDYIFAPSRLEALKRQDLLIEAARYVTTPVVMMIAGEGGQKQRYQQLIHQYDLQERVRLVGRISESEKIAYYANSLAVYFAPFDEDYGYITLEAWLSAKPIITATDSGGPTELVTHEQDGWIVEPDAQAIAATIDQAWQNKQRSIEMGRAGKDTYHRLRISWDGVIDRLLMD